MWEAQLDLWAGIPDELPANQPDIAAVHRIAEHPFDGVLTEEPEERRTFDLVQPCVLGGGRQFIKSCKQKQSLAVKFAGRLLALITLLRDARFERRLGVTITIPPVRTGQLTIDI